jgi:hypothetical protein
VAATCYGRRDAPAKNRTCARGLGSSFPKSHLQGQPLHQRGAPGNAPLAYGSTDGADTPSAELELGPAPVSRPHPVAAAAQGAASIIRTAADYCWSSAGSCASWAPESLRHSQQERDAFAGELSSRIRPRGRQTGGESAAVTAGCYLPREVFFGRLGFAGAFFTVWSSDFGRFLLATSDSFPMDVLPGAPYRASPALCRGSLPPGHGLGHGRPRRLAGDGWAQRRGLQTREVLPLWAWPSATITAGLIGSGALRRWAPGQC